MGAIPSQQVRITRGESDLLIYGDASDSHDLLCKHCGSLLISHIAENGNAHVTLGTLMNEPSLRPSFHIFVGSKASWYEINDDLPQFAELPG